MDNIQKRIFLATVSIASLLLLFPPWQKVIKVSPKILGNDGYSFIFYPPSNTAQINIQSLLVQFFFVTMIGAALIYYKKNECKREKVSDEQIKIVISAILEGDEDLAVASLKDILDRE